MTITDITGIIGYMGLTGAFFICVMVVLLSAFQHFRQNDPIENLLGVLTHSQSILLVTAFFSLAILLQSGAYEYEQVFNTVENSMTWVERIGGLWSGQSSSLLFWSLVMSGATSLSIPIAKSLSNKGYLKTVLLILEVTLLFFILPNVFISNPFMKIWMMPTGDITTAIFPPGGASLLVAVDGQGMNPQLRHVAMLLHPPTLYLGLIGFFLPYAFALAALVNRDAEHEWIQHLYPIALSSWMFLTIGMVLGSWWAYTILGWGGYWGWDAVEISGLLPWLLSFGLVHSLSLYMRKQPFRRWVYGFSFAIVILIMFGILITRSGILESVHAYASGAMGPVLTVLVLGHFITVILYTLSRKGLLTEKVDKNEIGIQENLFRWFNVCLVGLVLIYLFGQTLPLTSQIIYGEALTFSPENYKQISAPLLVILCIVTALCSQSSLKEENSKAFWQRIIVLCILAITFPVGVLFFTEFSLSIVIGFWVVGFLFLSWAYAIFINLILPVILKKYARKTNKRVGMLVVHLGLAVMAVGIVGVELLTKPFDRSIAPDEPLSISGYTFKQNKRDSYITDNGNVIFDETIEMIHPSGKTETLTVSINHISKSGSLHAVPTISVGFFQDVQVVLKGVPLSEDSAAEFRITFFPLMSWIWAGGGLMAGGGIVSMAIGKKRRNSMLGAVRMRSR